MSGRGRGQGQGQGQGQDQNRGGGRGGGRSGGRGGGSSRGGGRARGDDLADSGSRGGSGGGSHGDGGGGRGSRGGGRDYGGRSGGSDRGGGRGGERGGGRGGERGGGRGGGSSGDYRGGGRGGDYRGGGRGGGDRGGGRGGGDRGGGRGGGGGGRGPDLSGIQSVVTNILPAEVSSNFSFYIYTVDCKDKNDVGIEARGRRADLFRKGVFDGVMQDIPTAKKEELKRSMFFAGSFFFSGKPIPGLEKGYLPKLVVDGTSSGGDTMTIVQVQHFGPPECLTPPALVASQGEIVADTFRCADCAKTFKTEEHMLQHCSQTSHQPVYPPDIDGASQDETFLAYVNTILQRAMGERLRKWGEAYIDETKPIHGVSRQGVDLGIDIFEAFSCKFGIVRRENTKGAPLARLILTVDLRAKIMRTVSLLDVLEAIQDTSKDWSAKNQQAAQRSWVGERVMYTREKKGYTVVGLDFENSPDTKMVPDKKISHTEYFRQKGVILKYPKNKPMVVVLGRQDREIYLPPELVTGTELDAKVREQLPLIASFKPDVRSRAIDRVRDFLIPGARNAGGLLPSVGIRLDSTRLVVAAKVLGIPSLMAAGIPVPERSAENWAPLLSKARFNVNGNNATTLNVVVFHSGMISADKVPMVYRKICGYVNGFQSHYLFGDRPVAVIDVGKDDRTHTGGVSKYFSGRIPDNIFVLDFVKPRGATDPAYPIVKHMLGKVGHLSQFVSFKTCPHDNPRDERKSEMILQGVSRQILQKAGVALWWVTIPRSVPLPVIFVGVDVFHTPPEYDHKQRKRVRKPSCAAIIVQMMREHAPKTNKVELYSESFKQGAGEEFKLEDAYRQALKNALAVFKVSPASCIVWRDGIADSAFGKLAYDEIRGIRRGLEETTGKKQNPVQLAYLTCQKRIDNKFFVKGVAGIEDGSLSAPPGTMVASIQNLENQTFYINGRAPPYSTSKPVRFVVIERDQGIVNIPMSELTWGQCHAYPNWTGPIKVPAVCQMAHKFAELAGGMPDSGETIDHKKFANKIHFL